MKMKYLKKYKKYFLNSMEFLVPLSEFGDFITAADKDDHAISAIEGRGKALFAKRHYFRSDMYIIFLPKKIKTGWENFKNHCNINAEVWYSKMIKRKFILGNPLPINAKKRILISASLVDKAEYKKVYHKKSLKTGV